MNDTTKKTLERLREAAKYGLGIYTGDENRRFCALAEQLCDRALAEPEANCMLCKDRPICRIDRPDGCFVPLEPEAAIIPGRTAAMLFDSEEEMAGAVKAQGKEPEAKPEPEMMVCERATLCSQSLLRMTCSDIEPHPKRDTCEKSVCPTIGEQVKCIPVAKVERTCATCVYESACCERCMSGTDGWIPKPTPEEQRGDWVVLWDNGATYHERNTTVAEIRNVMAVNYPSKTYEIIPYAPVR